MQLAPDRAYDLILHGEDVRDRALIPNTPDASAITRIRQFDLDDQSVATLLDAPGNHGAHIERGSDLARIDFTAFVCENSSSRHHFQLRQLRQISSQAFCDA